MKAEKNLPKPDSMGFFTLKNLFKVLDQKDIYYSPAAIRNAIKLDRIPHRQTGEGIRSKKLVRLEDVVAWLQKFNSTKTDLTDLL